MIVFIAVEYSSYAWCGITVLCLLAYVRLSYVVTKLLTYLFNYLLIPHRHNRLLLSCCIGCWVLMQWRYICADVVCADRSEGIRSARSVCIDALDSDQHERLAANSHQRDHVWIQTFQTSRWRPRHSRQLHTRSPDQTWWHLPLYYAYIHTYILTYIHTHRPTYIGHIHTNFTKNKTCRPIIFVKKNESFIHMAKRIDLLLLSQQLLHVSINFLILSAS